MNDEPIPRGRRHGVERVLCTILPESLCRALGFLYGLTVRKRSFSQVGEDLILANYFEQIGLERGVYVDIGAFHPTWLSNTHLLHRRGWRGYAIDIDSYKVKAFSLLRGARCQAVLGAVAAQGGGSVEVYRFKRLWSEIDTLSKAFAERVRARRGFGFSTAQVPLIDVGEFFARLERVDLINIDIEGMDEEVLMNIDLGRLRPKVVVFEDNDHWGGSEQVRNYLSSHGYERLFISAPSVGYALRPGS